MMELIEVQHCRETVRPINVQYFNSNAFFSKIYMPLLYFLKISKLFDESENNEVYIIIKL